MATIDFADDFDDIATADITKRYTSVGGSSTISSGTGRRGTKSFHLVGTNTLTKSLATARSTIYLGVAISLVTPAATRQIFQLRNSGTNHVDVRVQTDGTIIVTRNGTTLGTASLGITFSKFFHFGLLATISDTVGTIDFFLNGVNVLSLTAQDTRNGATTNVNEIVLGPLSGGETCEFDDLIIASDTIGDKHVKTLTVTADGAMQDFSVGAGSGTHHLNVDDATPNDDTDYNTATAAGQQETYICGDPNPGEVITAFIVELLCKKTDAGSVTGAALVRHAGVNYQGPTTFAPSDTSYLYFREIYQTHPGTGLAPTAADLTGGTTEIGAKRVT